MAELLAQERPTINMCGSCLTIPYLELIIEALRVRGYVEVKWCAGAPTLMEIGAYLAESAKEAVQSAAGGV